MNKRIYIVWLLAISFWLLAERASGAAITTADLPYICGFEDATENANWVLNPNINTVMTDNRWVIGDALAYPGSTHSLYVSRDNGATSKYAATDNVLIAYRYITLEAGDYDVAYDWIGTGNKTKGYLKVVFANGPNSRFNCVGNIAEPSIVKDGVQLMGNNTSLVNGDDWRHVQARVTIPVAQANKTTTRLAFVWINTSVNKSDDLTSIAIDNFQLAKAMDNDDYPNNIRVTTNLGVSDVSWEAISDSFEVLYRKKGELDFDTLNVNEKKVTLSDVDYGAYEFWISSINENGKSAYTIFPTVYLYETD